MEDAGVETPRMIGCGCGHIGGWGEEPADGPFKASRNRDEFVGGELLDPCPVHRTFDRRVAGAGPPDPEERFQRRGGLGLAPPALDPRRRSGSTRRSDSG